MTGFDCICESIQLFEAALKTRDRDAGVPIRSVNELAKKAGYSVYHFTRLFLAITGVSPKEYIAGRILTEAAHEVAESKKTLSMIAFQLGYPDYETFSRAFKRHFARTPRQIRQLHYIPDGMIAKLSPQKNAATINLLSMEPEICERNSFMVTGLPFYIGPEVNNFHAQWALFLKIQQRITDRKQPETFYQYASWANADDFMGMSILCGLETGSQNNQEPIFTTRQIPDSKYMRFVHTGDIATIGSTYKYIYGDWLANHHMQPADLWEFQQYSAGGTRTEIWIPLVY